MIVVVVYEGKGNLELEHQQSEVTSWGPTVAKSVCIWPSVVLVVTKIILLSLPSIFSLFFFILNFYFSFSLLAICFYLHIFIFYHHYLHLHSL